jgi:hypothetical protein
MASGNEKQMYVTVIQFKGVCCVVVVVQSKQTDLGPKGREGKGCKGSNANVSQRNMCHDKVDICHAVG